MCGDLSQVEARVTGPLVPYVVSFSAELKSRGYRSGTVCQQIQFLAHVSRWLEEQSLECSGLTPARVEEFLSARQAAGYTKRISSMGMAPLLTHLRKVGVAPMPALVPTTPIDDLLALFRHYLLEERGIAWRSADDYVRVARLFLDEHSGVTDVQLKDLAAGDVLRFVTEQCRRRNPNCIATGLRAFLRYCYLQELMTSSLAGAIPRVASWSLSSLPKGLEPDQVRLLLKSCDRSTCSGARNFAILTVLVRLGLRASEVATLELGDIDWRSGEIVVRGKGPRIDRLPLPVDVGEAIVYWLQHGRPNCLHPNVFIRIPAPMGPLMRTGVSQVVRSACRQAGLPEVGAHRLRHTAATEMLRAGSNLTEIGQVLRHRDLATTAIYAKTDRSTLLAVAQPWPCVL